LGAEHKNLEGLKRDDHHGAGCDLTYETNKFIRIRLEARSPPNLGLQIFQVSLRNPQIPEEYRKRHEIVFTE
jgi:hypothetical protein